MIRLAARNGVDFTKSQIFSITAIDRTEISGKKPEIAGVAQLVEHPICNRAVGSSSLSASTISPHENGDTRPAFSNLIWLLSAIDLAI